ncbi:MAG TPA: glycerate kinase [Candidatus Limnocylindrales bacterium]|nr:glycerate kinase [Candidatus Limnocylindrales bacterium]
MTGAAQGGSAGLTVLFAPDSFKGSLTSVEVARALAAGWSRARPNDLVEHAPLGDGGEGTIHAVAYGGGWEWVRTSATSPSSTQDQASWLRSDDGRRAFVELAQASGLSKVDLADPDPIGATTRGTGELILQALDAGIRHVTLGIGGSATTDGGRGIIEALGGLDRQAHVDLSGLDPRLADVDLEIACDVTNPLLGPTGAAATYGPQKGATPDQVVQLDARNAAWADELEGATGRRERDTPGAGAAGGTGFGLLALTDRFHSLRLRPGVDLVMEASDFAAKLGRADVVVTGEGRIDAQTAFGKTALGVARRAEAAGVRCIAVGGGVDVAGIEALAAVGAVAVPVVERPQTVEQAVAAGPEPLVRCGERIARLVGLGLALGAESEA